MRFGSYIRTCREKSQLTQEALVHALYLFDDILFQGLDTTTISKWERGVTQPKTAKQLKILQFFQQNQQSVLPCLDDHSVTKNEALLCRKGVQNLIIGKRKDLVLNFPTKMMTLENLAITHVRHLDNMDTLLEIAADLKNSVHPPFTEIDYHLLRKWALHPGNLFVVCQYKGFIIGFLFVLRLRHGIQDEILHFNKSFNTLEEKDFVDYTEHGNHLITHFFAWNDKSATLLTMRYYAHLIANQHNIDSIGAVVYYEEAKDILSNMNLKPIEKFEEDGTEIMSYRESLENVLLTEKVMKMLFRKEECPEE